MLVAEWPEDLHKAGRRLHEHITAHRPHLVPVTSRGTAMTPAKRPGPGGAPYQICPENWFLRRVGFTILPIRCTLPLVAACRDERGEPAVRHRADVAVPQPRYEVILALPDAWRRPRGRRRSS
jgi:hypothetical protein